MCSWKPEEQTPVASLRVDPDGLIRQRDAGFVADDDPEVLTRGGPPFEDNDLFRRTADNGYAVARELLDIDRTIEATKQSLPETQPARMPDDARPLRVLRVIARLNVGGPALHTIILNDGLRRRGLDTLLVYGSVGPQEASFEDLARARALPTVHVPQLGRRISFFDDALALARVVGLVWRWAPDVVHTHTAKAGTLGASPPWSTMLRRAGRDAVRSFTRFTDMCSRGPGLLGSAAA
jgi:hypothetical protein